MLAEQLLGHGVLVEVVHGTGARQQAGAAPPEGPAVRGAAGALVDVEHARDPKLHLVQLRAHQRPQLEQAWLTRLVELIATGEQECTLL